MNPHSPNELAKKLKELNTYFASMISKMKSDMEELDQQVQSGKAFLESHKTQQILPRPLPAKAKISRKLLQNWEPQLN